MMGIDPVDLRRRMEESLDAIIRLLRMEEPVTMATDWFELREARLHLAPYSDPRFHIAVAARSRRSAWLRREGMARVLSIGAGLPGGPEAMPKQCGSPRRPPPSTRDDEPQGLADRRRHAHRRGRRGGAAPVKSGERHETTSYFEETLGRVPGTSQDPCATESRR